MNSTPFTRFSIPRVLAVAILASGLALPKPAAAQNVDLSEFDVSATPNGFAIQGANPLDSSGLRVSGAGDVNGDGFADILIGAKGSDGLNGARNNAGASYVIFGKAAGFSNIDLATINSGTTTNGFAILGARASDYSGWSVSGAGDVNGDGFADVLICARYGDGPNDSRDYAGDSYVLFGKASGISNFDLATFNAGSTAAGFAILGGSPFDQAGRKVSGAGDVNGDGFADLLIAAYNDSGPGNTRTIAGRSYVLFGKASGFTNIDLATLESEATDNGFAILGVGIGDQSGYSLSGAGDVNGDGFADIIIGAHNADGPGDARNRAGDSYVVFGKAAGFSNIDLASFNDGATAEVFTIQGALANDVSGFTVAGAGDVNGDGFADVIIGAYRADGPGDTREQAGDSYVLFGKSSGFTSIDLATFNAGATSNGFAILGALASDVSGSCVAGAGDVNGDGFGDILIGAIDADGPSDTRNSAGDSYLLYGKASGFTNIDLATLDAGATASGFTILGSQASDLSGFSLSGAGDVNGDGLADIVIGAPGEDGPSNTRTSTGETYVLFGKGTATSATYKSFAKTGDAPNIAIGNGNDSAPDSRTWIDFADGSNASLQTVTLTRNNSSITNLPSTGKVMWQLSTNRTGWTSAEITFKYTDAEITGLSESNLKLFTASSTSGPWTEVSGTTLIAEKNQISGTVSSMGIFAIAVGSTPNTQLWTVY